MTLMSAGDFNRMTPDQITATVECQKRDAAVRSAMEELGAGRISSSEARARSEEAYDEFREACKRGLHFDI